MKLTEKNSQRLEDAGFQWSLRSTSMFDERYAELTKYKEKFRHCGVRRRSGEYPSLGSWCAQTIRCRRSKTERHQNETNGGEYAANRGRGFQVEHVSTKHI